MPTFTQHGLVMQDMRPVLESLFILFCFQTFHQRMLGIDLQDRLRRLDLLQRARVELLKKLWADGLSASQIAAQLGGVTRNAVIGKVHRLGLAGRATPSRPAKRPVRTQRPRIIGPTAPRMRPPSMTRCRIRWSCGTPKTPSVEMRAFCSSTPNAGDRTMTSEVTSASSARGALEVAR